jgi:hypothetical protein
VGASEPERRRLELQRRDEDPCDHDEGRARLLSRDARLVFQDRSDGYRNLRGCITYVELSHPSLCVGGLALERPIITVRGAVTPPPKTATGGVITPNSSFLLNRRQSR